MKKHKTHTRTQKVHKVKIRENLSSNPASEPPCRVPFFVFKRRESIPANKCLRVFPCAHDIIDATKSDINGYSQSRIHGAHETTTRHEYNPYSRRITPDEASEIKTAPFEFRKSSD